MRWILTALVLTACAPKAMVQVPASPAVPVPSATFSVVSKLRHCRPIADALVKELNQLEGVTVDPHSPVRLTVETCDQPALPVQVDIHIDGDREERRVTVQGSGYALVSVSVNDEKQGHLLGSTRRSAGEEGARPSALFRSLEAELVQSVAEDLAEQIRPIPKWVARPLYTRARRGSARELYNLAVEAEQIGEVHKARALAWSAHSTAPSDRISRYLQELDRRLALAP